MMREFFFGSFAIVGWMVASAAMLFFAIWILLIVLEVRGLRGAALATLFFCIGTLFGCFALLLHEAPHISKTVVGVIATAVCMPIPWAAFILADLYSADRNSHRSFTARSYNWYKRVTKSEPEEQDPRHPFSAKGV